MGEVSPTARTTELCLHSLLAQGLGNGNEHYLLGSQSTVEYGLFILQCEQTKLRAD